MGENMHKGPESPTQPATQPDPMGLSTTSMGMQPNVEAGCNYIPTQLTGLIFFLSEKQKFVRFHAIQTICLGVLAIALGLFTRSWWQEPSRQRQPRRDAAAGEIGILGLLFMLI